MKLSLKKVLTSRNPLEWKPEQGTKIGIVPRNGRSKDISWIRTNPFRGVCGMMDMNNEYQEALHYPDNGFGNQSDSHETGMGQLFVQVQNVQHRIIWPDAYSQSKLEGCDWW